MSDSLIEDEFSNRPDDDELAFVHFERLFRGPLDKELIALKETEGGQYWDSYNHFMQTYINNVIATVKALELDILSYWVNNPTTANDSRRFKQIKFDIDAALVEIKVRKAQILRKRSVRLAPEAREKIRSFINKIKLTIEGIDLPDPRKESLMEKLNAFAADVDRDRTKFEAFGALGIEAATIAGKAEHKVRPIRKWIESIASVMREATTLESAQGRLPAPPARIPAAPKQISPPAEEIMWEEPKPPERPKATALELALAWGFVGIPLLWGIYSTLVNAMKLFQ
jgi:hypothetical protein